MRINYKTKEVGELQEFTSSNGIKMIYGHRINWKKQPIYQGQEDPYVLSIYIGGLDEGWNCNYHWEEKKLIITNVAYSSEESLPFYCDSLAAAEIMVISFAKGKNKDILPLYLKD